MCRQNTYGILLQNISNGLELFWDDLKKKFRVRHTHFRSNLGFLRKNYLHSSLVKFSNNVDSEDSQTLRYAKFAIIEVGGGGGSS